MSHSNKLLSPDYDNTITLLNIYLSEWQHRDQIISSEVFKIYYAILIVILLPNLAPYLQIELPEIPFYIFRVIGLLLSFVFLYVSLGYYIRLHSLSNTCKKIIDKLPIEYQKESLTSIKIKNIPIGKIFMPRLSYILCFALFISLFSLSLILMII